MNLSNKITIARIYLSIFISVVLIFPFDAVGLNLPKLFVNESLVFDIRYIIAGVLFVIASITDFIDGNIARKNNLVTDFGKVMDAIADKVLVNGVLILLAAPQWGIIPSVIVPVIIITRDIAVDSITMVSGSKGKVVSASWPGKIKTICMMVGLSLTFFSNLPFELLGVRLDYILLIIATVLSIYSGIQYFMVNKQFFLEDK